VTTGSPGSPPGAVIGADRLAGREVEEVPEGLYLRLRDRERSVPGLVLGITTAPAGDFGVSARDDDMLRTVYADLAGGLGFTAVAVPRQVHGTDVRRIRAPRLPGPDGRPVVRLAGRVDGLVTSGSGILLVSTAADCVPVYMLDAARRVVGLAHAGWRGVAAGVLTRALESMRAAGADPTGISVHLGPAICGACYEVDAPVLRALGAPGERERLDLRGLLVDQALAAGVVAVTVSTHCTRCGSAELHSHRGTGGQAGRMAAFIGIRKG